MTFGDWAADWLDTALDDRADKTREQYCDITSRYLLPALGARDMDLITTRDIRAIIARCRGEGKGRTCQLIRVVARLLWADAIEAGVCQGNPTLPIRTPRHRTSSPEALLEEHVAALVAAGQDSPYWIAYALMLRAGLRRGEAIALRWQDVRDGRLYICRQAVLVGGELRIGPPKSAAGTRMVPISDSLAREIAAARWAARCRRTLHPQRTVAQGPDGGLLRPTTLRKQLDAICRAAGLPHCTMHQLRHTFATLAIQRGLALPSLQYILGHSTPAVTLGVYSHAQLAYTMADWERHCGAL